jgi:hypothetical protein
MDDAPTGAIPARLLRPGLSLRQVKRLLRDHGARIRNVDNHHWQISQGERSALWMTGDDREGDESALDEAALVRLERVLRHSGLLREEALPLAAPLARRPMRAAILWIGAGATRVYWVNDQGLAEGAPLSLGHWLHGEFTLHPSPRPIAYLRRIVAMLERIERVLLIGQRTPRTAEPSVIPSFEPAQEEAIAEAGPEEGAGEEGQDFLHVLVEQLRPELRRRVVGVINLESGRLDDALLFAMAREYLIPHSGEPDPT